MDPRKNPWMKKQDRKGGDREATFFARLINTAVWIETDEGVRFGGKLLWVGPYTLIIQIQGRERLYWKHGLRSIEQANGRGDA